MTDAPTDITTTSTEVEQVQMPFRRVHNRGSFYLRQHVQSEVRQVEELTEHMVRKWFEDPRTSHREVCEVINTTDPAFKFICHLAKRMMFFCGFHLRYTVKNTEKRKLIIYEWSPMTMDEQKAMVEHEQRIMPTKEQLEQQRRPAGPVTAPAPASPAPQPDEPAQEQPPA